MRAVSQRFKVAVKLGNKPAYKYAQAAGIDPTILSKLINGIVPVKENDPRVTAVARVLGLQPEECFQEVNDVK